MPAPIYRMAWRAGTRHVLALPDGREIDVELAAQPGRGVRWRPRGSRGPWQQPVPGSRLIAITDAPASLNSVDRPPS
jgi:hypothetical protein